jgi:TPR repeat protein
VELPRRKYIKEKIMNNPCETCNSFVNELKLNQAYELVENGNFKEAFVLLSESLSHCPRAQFLLGGLYGNGDYVTQDIVKANHYFKLAADQGFEPAMHYYAINLIAGRGVESSNENVRAGITLFHKVALLGYPEAVEYFEKHFCEDWDSYELTDLIDLCEE